MVELAATLFVIIVGLFAASVAAGLLFMLLYVLGNIFVALFVLIVGPPLWLLGNLIRWVIGKPLVPVKELQACLKIH